MSGKKKTCNGGDKKILNEKCRDVRPTQNLFQTGYKLSIS